MQDYFKIFDCHICGETKNSNHNLKKHYILSHYSTHLKNLKGETEFPSECQFGIELGCLEQFQNYEDYLVHLGTDHDKLFDVMINSEISLDFLRLSQHLASASDGLSLKWSRATSEFQNVVTASKMVSWKPGRKNIQPRKI